MSSYLDPIIFVMLTLKNNWSLTGDLTGSKIGWSTRWYDKEITMPQISTTPGDTPVRQLNVGSGTNVTIRMMPMIDVNCWIRPKTSAKTGQFSTGSLGEAKNMRHQMREEVLRIIKASGSNVQGLNYVTVNDMNEFDELDERPPYLRTHIELLGWAFR